MTTCQECGGKCCKVAQFECGPQMQRFMIGTRNAIATDNGVLIPARCRYLDQNNACTIYDKRPDACAMWMVNGDPCLTVQRLIGSKT